MPLSMEPSQLLSTLSQTSLVGNTVCTHVSAAPLHCVWPVAHGPDLPGTVHDRPAMHSRQRLWVFCTLLDAVTDAPEEVAVITQTVPELSQPCACTVPPLQF